MNQGFTIAGAAYRLMGSILISLVAVLVLPLTMSLALTFVGMGQKGVLAYAIQVAEFVTAIVYGAALLRILLHGAPMSVRSLHFGRDEMLMSGCVLVLAIFFDLLQTVYFAVIMGPLMLLTMLLNIHLASGLHQLVFMGGYVVVFGYVILRLVTMWPSITSGQADVLECVTEAWKASRGHSGPIIFAALLAVAPVAILGFAIVQVIVNNLFDHGYVAKIMGWAVMDYVELTAAACLSVVVFQLLAKSKESG